MKNKNCNDFCTELHTCENVWPQIFRLTAHIRFCRKSEKPQTKNAARPENRFGPSGVQCRYLLPVYSVLNPLLTEGRNSFGYAASIFMSSTIFCNFSVMKYGFSMSEITVAPPMLTI